MTRARANCHSCCGEHNFHATHTFSFTKGLSSRCQCRFYTRLTREENLSAPNCYRQCVLYERLGLHWHPPSCCLPADHYQNLRRYGYQLGLGPSKQFVSKPRFLIMGSYLYEKLVVAPIMQYSARDEPRTRRQSRTFTVQDIPLDKRTNTEPSGMRLGLPITFSALVASAAGIASPLTKRLTGPQGIDVSNWQKTIDWGKVKSQGVAFAYIKATEGTDFIDAFFSNNYIGATNNSIIRGAYHFAHPDVSSGAAQAEYFLAHGGGWSSDGITLPGAIDLEGNCSGLSASRMVAWIKDFSDTYHSRVQRYPVIYVSRSWWTQCTENSADFGSTNPLWTASWASDVGPLPAGWSYTTFWQYANSGSNPGDQDLFNGDAAGLSQFAKG